MQRLNSRDKQVRRVIYIDQDDSEEETDDDEEQLVLRLDGKCPKAVLHARIIVWKTVGS